MSGFRYTFDKAAKDLFRSELEPSAFVGEVHFSEQYGCEAFSVSGLDPKHPARTAGGHPGVYLECFVLLRRRRAEAGIRAKYPRAHRLFAKGLTIELEGEEFAMPHAAMIMQAFRGPEVVQGLRSVYLNESGEFHGSTAHDEDLDLLPEIAEELSAVLRRYDRKFLSPALIGKR